jgi:hypothetical protein
VIIKPIIIVTAAVLQQLTSLTDLGSMVRFPATAPVMGAFFVPDFKSFRDFVA